MEITAFTYTDQIAHVDTLVKHVTFTYALKEKYMSLEPLCSGDFLNKEKSKSLKFHKLSIKIK